MIANPWQVVLDKRKISTSISWYWIYRYLFTKYNVSYELLELPGSNATYEKAGRGQLDCSQLNGEVISDCRECAVAAYKLGFIYTGTKTDSDFPKGCYEVTHTGSNYINKVFCNKHNIGTREEDSSPICKVEGNIILEQILS